MTGAGYSYSGQFRRVYEPIRILASSPEGRHPNDGANGMSWNLISGKDCPLFVSEFY